MRCQMMHKKGKESVWDYPRPPKVEPYHGLVEIHHKGYNLAKSSGSCRVLETSHPPVFYIPPKDIMMELLQKTKRTSMCEFKGMAVYCQSRLKMTAKSAEKWRKKAAC